MLPSSFCREMQLWVCVRSAQRPSSLSPGAPQRHARGSVSLADQEPGEGWCTDPARVDLVLSWGPSLQPVRSLLPPGPGSLHLGVCVVPSLLLQVPIEGLGVLSPPAELVRSKHLDCLGAVLGKGCPQGLPRTESPAFWSGCPSAPPLCSEPASRLWSVSFAPLFPCKPPSADPSGWGARVPSWVAHILVS